MTPCDLSKCYSIEGAWFQRMMLQYFELLSNLAFNFNFRRYTMAVPCAVSSVAHALSGAALGLVLVFKTNSSFGRLVEARVLLGAMVKFVRDLARLARAYTRSPLSST
jgi:predicted membrane chloride channel (bestrophin family)